MKDQNELMQQVLQQEVGNGIPEPTGSAPVVDVGARLSELRKGRNLTLQQAAKMTGVSASAWSKIERNELSPTISTVQRIAKGAGIELVELLGGNGNETPAYGRRCVTRAGNGSVHETMTCENRLLSTDLRNKSMTPVLTRVTARAPDEYSAWARSNAEIFLIVMSGTLIVHSRLYEPVVLEKGDSMYYDANSDHVWTSLGGEDASVLWVISIA